MIFNSSRRLALAALVVGVTLSACGSSTGTAPTTAATPGAVTPGTAAPAVTAIASLSATQAPAGCPTAATVGAALGVTVNNPVGVAGGGGNQLPTGATGLVCDYPGKGLNVIIELIANVSPTYIAQFSGKFPVPYATVSGLGDQARSFSQSFGAGKDNKGVVAIKGSNLVDITATDTAASLAQIEALANQLL
jgi:hypothetical protein